MHVTKAITALLISAIAISCTPSTDWEESVADISDEDINLLYDNLYENADSIISIIKDFQTSDSLLHYRLNNVLSRAYYAKGEIGKALEANEHSLTYCSRHNGDSDNDLLAAESLNNKAVYLMAMNMTDSAMACFETAYQLHCKNKDVKAQINTIINMADNSYTTGHYAKSSRLYHKALLLADSLNIQDYNLPIYSGLAKLYLEIGNYPMADIYFNHAEKYIEGCTTYERYYFYNSRGNYYYYIGKYDKALPWFRKAYQLIDGGISRMTSSCNIGEVFLYLNEIDSSRKYINEAITLCADMKSEVATYYIKSIQAYLALQEEDYTKAKELIHELRHDYTNMPPEYIYLLNKRLHQYYIATHDYRRAYRYLREIVRYDDSLRSVKTLNNLTEASLRYKNDTTIMAKNKKIKESKEEISQLTFITVVAVMSFVIALLLFSYIILYKKKKQEKIRQEYIATINNYKLKVIKNRVTPHFIFNVLNAIMPSFRSHKELEVPIRSMVRLLRSGIIATESITINLENEIRYVKDYITLFTISKGLEVKTIWEIDPAINTETCLIPTMFIQLPVENALKYAYVGIDNPTLTISVKSSNGIEIAIEDNGTGFKDDDCNKVNENGAGVGLNTMSEILRLLNKNKSKKIILEITHNNDGCGTKVTISIPTDYKYTL